VEKEDEQTEANHQGKGPPTDRWKDDFSYHSDDNPGEDEDHEEDEDTGVFPWAEPHPKPCNRFERRKRT
jgi:hypothetical protein